MTRSVRMKISGLMAVVLVVAVGLAALRSGSDIWAGAWFLLTCGALALAAVGSVFDTRGARAWWLGFAIFGCGYLVLAFSYPPLLLDAPYPPTDSLLRFAMPYVGPGPSWLPGAHGLADNPYLQTGHCLLGLLAGTLGGVLAHALFSGAPVDPPPASCRSGRPSRLAVLGLIGFVLLAATAMAGARKAPGTWAGAIVLLIWGLLGLTTVGAACGQRRRARLAWERPSSARGTCSWLLGFPLLS